MDTSRASVPPRVLILGAGWLGAPLADAFAAAGAVVTTVRRSAHSAPAGGHAVAVDLHTLTAPHASPIPEALCGHAVVLAMVAPDRARGDDHAHTYPPAAAAAARIAAETGARALLWVSSTGVYGYDDGREVTEDTPRLADSPSQRALCAAEDQILAAARDTLRVGVLRVSGLYGPGRDPAARYRDTAALAPRAAHWVNLAWRDDVVAAIQCWTAHAISAAIAPPRIVNVSDGTPLTIAECARLVARADGRAFVMPAAAPAATDTGAGAASPPRSNQRIRVDTLRSLGWTPQVPTLHVGLLRLGYTRLAHEQQPYGPHTAAIRAFLRDLAALDSAQHAAAMTRWTQQVGTPEFVRADRLLGEVLVRAGREAERDAAAGPLLQLLRAPRDAAAARQSPLPSAIADHDTEHAAPDTLDPIAEPALAALMALIVHDLLPPDAFETLTHALREVVPPAVA
jgi:nucleoside-diphosphate-sugar epimerase